MASQATLEILLKAQDQTRAAFEAVQKSNEKIAEQVGKINKTVSDAGENAVATGAKFSVGFAAAGAALGAVAAGAQAAYEVIGKLAEEAERIHNKALISGFADESVQSLQRLAKNTQVSGELVFSAIARMQRAAVDGRKGFTDLGISVDEFLKLAPEDQLQAVAEKIMSLPTAAERAAAALDLFGRSGEQLLPVLAELAERGTVDIVTMSRSQIKSLKEVDHALDSLSGAWTDFTNQVTAAAAAAGGTSFLQGTANELRGMAQILKEGGIFRFLELLIQAGSGPMGAASAAWAEMAANARVIAEAASRGGGAEWSGFALPPAPWQQPQAEGPFRMEGLLSEAQARGLEMQRKIDEQRAASARKLQDELARLEQRQIDGAMRVEAAELRSLDNLDKADAAFTRNRMANEEQIIAAEQRAVDAQLRDEERLTAQMNAEEARRLADAERAAEQRRAAMARILDEIGTLFMQFGVKADSALGMAINGFQNLGNAALGAMDALAQLASGNIWGAIASGIGVISAAVSGLKSLWNSIFGKSEIEKINDTRDAFISAHGGWLNLQHEIARATDEDLLKKLFDADTVQEYEDAIKAIQEALDKLSGTVVDPIVVPVVYDDPGYEGQAGGGGGEGAPAAKRGAIILPFVPRAQQGAIVQARPGGSLLRVGEGGEAELAAPIRALADRIGSAAAAAAAGAGGTIHVHLHLSEKEIADVMVKRNKAGLAPMRGA